MVSQVFLLANSEVFFMASRDSSDLGFCRCRNEDPHCWESKTYKDSLCCFLSVSQNVVFACYTCCQECCLSNLCLFDLFNFIYIPNISWLHQVVSDLNSDLDVRHRSDELLLAIIWLLRVTGGKIRRINQSTKWGLSILWTVADFLLKYIATEFFSDQTYLL